MHVASIVSAPVQQLRQTADGFAGIRPGPMSSSEWLITDPMCLSRGATGAAPSPVSLGGSASPGKPLTPDQQPADQKYMATVVPSVCGTSAHLAQ